MISNNQQPDAKSAITNLSFANNMLHHLIQYKGNPNPKSDQPQAPEQAPQTMDTPDTETPVEDKTEPQEEPKTESVDTTKQDEEKMKMFKDTLEKTVQEISTKYESKLQDSDKKAKGAIEAIKKEVKSILNG